MYRLSCEIEISTSAGTIRLDHATGVSIAKHADSLTDVATITLPRRIRWKGVESNPIKRGDTVSISLGYDGRNHLAFVGTVARVNPTTPMTVECQDPMSAWQTVSAKAKAYTSVSLSTLLSDQGVEATVMGSQALGAYRVECQTVSELLDALKKQGVRTMYRIGAGTEPKLYAGLLLKPDDARTFDFDDTRNVVSRSSLNYEPADDVRFLVRVKNHSTVESGKRKNAKMKPVEVGYVLSWEAGKERKQSNSRNSVYCCFALYYNESRPKLWICVGDNNWGQNKEMLMALRSAGNSDAGPSPVFDENSYYVDDIPGYWFRMKEESFERLENTEANEQCSIVERFVDSVTKFMLTQYKNRFCE